MLDSIRLQNFKTHRDTEIKLGRLTVLVGPNGAGKSSVLQAIALLSEPTKRSAYKSIARPGEIIGDCEIQIAGHYANGNPWSLTSRGASMGSWVQNPPALDATQASETQIDGNHANEWPLGLRRDLYYTKVGKDERDASLRAVMLTPDPETMAAPVRITDVSPQLHRSGWGLADVVATMRDNDEDSFQALQAALRAVVPQVERIKVQRQLITEDSSKYVAYGLLFDVAGRKDIPASAMSGGTLLALAILALLHSPQRPRILLLDDIDHGLHPKAQWDLLKQLRRLLEQFPDLQIVATSHSPDLVDELDPSEVIVLALREDGTSAAKPLTACPREDMLGVLKAGQLWSAIGEDWVKSDDSVEPVP